MNRIYRTFLLSLLLLVTSSCAGMVRGKTETLFFDSHPRGALVSLSNYASCTTPCALEVQRENLEIRFSKEGCESQDTVVPRVLSIDGALLTALSALPVGVVGAPVFLAPGIFFPVLEDIEHGGAYRFRSNLVEATLKCK
jgi:hypothetical protein